MSTLTSDVLKLWFTNVLEIPHVVKSTTEKITISVKVWKEDGRDYEGYSISTNSCAVYTGRKGFLAFRKELQGVPYVLYLNGTLIEEDEFFKLIGIEI